jgi:ELWxxDGT repeat protein
MLGTAGNHLGLYKLSVSEGQPLVEHVQTFLIDEFNNIALGSALLLDQSLMGGEKYWLTRFLLTDYLEKDGKTYLTISMPRYFVDKDLWRDAFFDPSLQTLMAGDFVSQRWSDPLPWYEKVSVLISTDGTPGGTTIHTDPAEPFSDTGPYATSQYVNLLDVDTITDYGDGLVLSNQWQRFISGMGFTLNPAFAMPERVSHPLLELREFDLSSGVINPIDRSFLSPEIGSQGWQVPISETSDSLVLKTDALSHPRQFTINEPIVIYDKVLGEVAGVWDLDRLAFPSAPVLGQDGLTRNAEIFGKVFVQGEEGSYKFSYQSQPHRRSVVEGGGYSSLSKKFFFPASDQKTGTELWSTDGTKEGTYMVSDLNPGPGSSMPKDFYMTPDGKHLYFTAVTEELGRQLYSIAMQ